jgi:hypothetical protein
MNPIRTSLEQASEELFQALERFRLLDLETPIELLEAHRFMRRLIARLFPERALPVPEPKRPRIVCLCGSTRFGEAFAEANLRETVAGRIVLSIGCCLKSDDKRWPDAVTRETLKEALDELHLRKIDLADEILVLNVKGYVGESTAREIDYARAQGKPVRYWEAAGDGAATAGSTRRPLTHAPKEAPR